MRIHSHKVFNGLARRGKTSTGWFYGLKLHLIIHERGELLGIRVTPGHVDDRVPAQERSHQLWGKLFGDKGYVSQELFEILFAQGIELITKTRKSMKNRLISLMDRILLKKRALIETVNDQLKNISQIEHTRHRGPLNAMVNLIAGLISYPWRPKKPSIILTGKERDIVQNNSLEHKLLVF